jgi:SAM-dependent methyltransferase
MASGDKVFTGSIPELYDRFLVPLIFESYAADLAGRVAKTSPHHVLETAAGTGVLTRAMASRLPAPARIVATDLNQPMLDHAAAKSPDRRIQWRQADALALPFPDQSFDAVACQFGVMFFPDRVQGCRETRRVLKPGGHWFFSAWDRMSANEFVSVASQALAELYPHDPPRFMERAPHGYHDVDRIRADVKAAGFADATIDVVDAKSRAATPCDAAIAYCQGNPWRNEIEARDPDGLERATEHVAAALARRFGEGPIEGRIRALVVTARR